MYGEFEIPYQLNAKKVKRIAQPEQAKFIESLNDEYPGLLEKQGVYIFCLRAGKGTLPWYVGKAGRSLMQEILTSDKLVKYNSILFDRTRGVPVFYFVAPKGRGKQVHGKYLPLIEETLIARAYQRNRNLANIRLVSGETWVIDGVMGGVGRRRTLAEEEREFSRIMGIEPDRKSAN